MSGPSTRNSSPPNHERLVFPIVTALASLGLWVLPGVWSMDTQLLLLGVLVILLGLPHGALDPWVAERAGLVRTTIDRVVFNVVYVLLAGLVVVVWVWAPVFSLAVFLAISAWHFASDWESDWHGRYTSLPRFFAGAMLLLLPIGFHTENVAMIFDHLSGIGGADLAHALALPEWLLGLLMAALITVSGWQGRWWAALEYLSLLILAFVAQPLIYFVIYFCAQHSLRHMASILRQAKPSKRPDLWRTLVIYTIITLVFALGLWWMWSNQTAQTVVLRLVFIGLAALTVPHMILMWCDRQFASHP